MIDLHPAAQRAIGLVTSVDDDQLGLPTPCPDSSVGDLIDHIGVFSVRFVAAARKESDGNTSPPPPSVTNLEPGWRQRISRDLAELADAWQVPEAWQGTTYAGGIELPGEIVGLVVSTNWSCTDGTSRWPPVSHSSRRRTRSKRRCRS